MPQKVFLTFLFLFLAWVMIAGFDAEEIILGSIVSFIISILLSREFIKGKIIQKFNPRRWIIFLVYIIVFLSAEIYSHLELAMRIFSGKTDDGIFVLKSRFKDPVALTTLGNSITLTPGTLTLDVKGNKLVTYRVSRSSERMMKIFETFLEGVFK